MTKYADKVPLEKRIAESNAQRIRNPTYVPVIVDASDDMAAYMTKNKFLVPQEITVAMFIITLRKNMKLADSKAIFLFTNKTLPMANATIGDVYKKWLAREGIDDQNYKKRDLFLYCYLTTENCFGEEA